MKLRKIVLALGVLLSLTSYAKADMSKIIYKILTPCEWKDFQKSGSFKGSLTDQKDGFIHAALEEQYPRVIEKFFKDVRPIILLKIDATLLPKGSIKIEANKPSGDKYPHIYGVIPLEAVVSSEVIKQRTDILKLTESYVAFLNEVGEMDPSEIQESTFPRFWSPKCTKIMNGKKEYEDGSSFLSQLKDVRTQAGKLKVTLKDLIIGKWGNMSSIRYLIESEHWGSFEVSAFLSFDEKGLLTEVSEVFCSVS